MELNPSLREHVKKLTSMHRSRRIGAGLLSAMCLAGLAVSGCQPHSATRNPASPYFVLPLGTTVTLLERLDIGPRRVRAYSSAILAWPHNVAAVWFSVSAPVTL